MWAVAHADFFDNNIIIEFITAETWYDAIKRHSELKDLSEWPENPTLDEIKDWLFDMDALVDVKAVPVP